MQLDSRIKKGLLILAVPLLGFLLICLTFYAYCWLNNGINYIFSGIIDPNITQSFFLLIIAVVSIAVYRSKIKEEFKAIFTVVPMAVTFVIIMRLLKDWPITAYAINAIIFFAAMYILYSLKKSWVYYYSVILVVVTFIVMIILGIEF